MKLCLFHFYVIELLRDDIPLFLTANIASQTSKRHLSAFNIWKFSRRFSRNLTPRAPSNTLTVVFLFYRRYHTFDVKTCFQQNRYVFDIIVTSWALFVFCVSWNFARDISTVFEEIKHLVVVHQTIFYQIIKINKTLLLKYC
jgi:hypothetical protein